jgi:hypothetical protein
MGMGSRGLTLLSCGARSACFMGMMLFLGDVPGDRRRALLLNLANCLLKIRANLGTGLTSTNRSSEILGLIFVIGLVPDIANNCT